MYINLYIFKYIVGKSVCYSIFNTLYLDIFAHLCTFKHALMSVFFMFKVPKDMLCRTLFNVIFFPDQVEICLDLCSTSGSKYLEVRGDNIS